MILVRIPLQCLSGSCHHCHRPIIRFITTVYFQCWHYPSIYHPKISIIIASITVSLSRWNCPKTFASPKVAIINRQVCVFLMFICYLWCDHRIGNLGQETVGVLGGAAAKPSCARFQGAANHILQDHTNTIFYMSVDSFVWTCEIYEYQDQKSKWLVARMYK